MPELFINPTATEIGERIRRLREQRGFSQKEVAEGVGITPSRLCHYEKGADIPGTIILLRIALFMDSSMDYLCQGRLEEVVERIGGLLRRPFMELQDFSDECRRAVYDSAYAHMSREIMEKRARRNPDTGIIRGNPKKERGGS